MALPVTPRSPTTIRQQLAAGWALKRIRELVDPLPLGARQAREAEMGPLPPRRLRARAGAAGAVQYAEGGRLAAGELATVLSAGGRPPGDLRSVLDFGSGAGRVLPHFAALAPEAGCVGCDVDQSAIGWARSHHPGLEWDLTSFAPPLPYADGRFELIYSISVFSHLGSATAMAWLADLRRVLAPEGVALLSVYGRHAFEAFRTGRARTTWCDPEVFARAPLGDQEFVFAPYTRSLFTEGDLPGIGRDYGLAFLGPGYVRAAWGRELAVLDVWERALTGWQDIVVCRRPP